MHCKQCMKILITVIVFIAWAVGTFNSFNSDRNVGFHSTHSGVVVPFQALK